MVHEIATILIRPGTNEEFEHSFSEAVPLFKRAKGCQSLRLERSVDNPLRYLIIVGWETWEDHVIRFRASADHGRWRKLVSRYFDGSPSVDHTEAVIEGF